MSKLVLENVKGIFDGGDTVVVEVKFEGVDGGVFQKIERYSSDDVTIFDDDCSAMELYFNKDEVLKLRDFFDEALKESGE